MKKRKPRKSKPKHVVWKVTRTVEIYMLARVEDDHHHGDNIYDAAEEIRKCVVDNLGANDGSIVIEPIESLDQVPVRGHDCILWGMTNTEQMRIGDFFKWDTRLSYKSDFDDLFPKV
jgi:hypothetical protein